MEFKATMTGQSLPNILKLFSSKKITGALEISDSEFKGAIWLRSGQIVYAYSTKAMQLKDSLKSLNLLSPEKLDSLSHPSINDFNIDKYLVENGIAPDKLVTYIRSHQIADTLYSMVDLDKADYELKADQPFVIGREDLLPANYNWMTEIYQNMYTWVQMRGKLPKGASRLKQKPLKEQLSKEDEKIYKACDGKRTIKDIVLWSGTTYYKAYTLIAGLVTKGLLEFEEDISAISPKILSEIIKVLDSMEQMPGIKSAFVVDKEGKMIAKDSRKSEGINSNETLAAIFSQTVSGFEKNLSAQEDSSTNELIEQLWVERNNGDKTLLFVAGKVILVTEALKDCDWGLLKLSAKRSMNSIRQLISVSA